MPTLEQALSTFLHIDRSPHTARNYRSTLLPLVAAIGPQRDLALVSYADLVDYIARLQDNLKPSSFAQYVQVIRTFFNWCVRHHYLASSPACGLFARKPPRDPALSRAIPADVLREMQRLAYARPRDSAILLFLADTGCRVGGIATLTLPRLNLDELSAYLLEKGSRFHQVFFGDETGAALRRWLAERPAVQHEYVFTGRCGRPLRRDAFAAIVQRLSRRASGRTYGPHSIRHAVACAWAERGVLLTDTQRKLGHSDPRITLEAYYPQNDWRVRDLSRQLALAALHDPDRVEQPPPRRPKIIHFRDYA